MVGTGTDSKWMDVPNSLGRILLVVYCLLKTLTQDFCACILLDAEPALLS